MMKKLQAAMEYLMTYGWAILIIALALGVLYSLGVFNPNRLKPVGCFLPAPFTCQIQTFKGSNGNLTLLIGQGSGQTITITNVACVDNSLLTNNGLPTSGFIPTSKTLASGGSIPITVNCKKSDNNFLTNGNIGDTFSGSLVVQYTIGSNPYYTIGSISAQINTP
jgi:hypothetical protein